MWIFVDHTDAGGHASMHSCKAVRRGVWGGSAWGPQGGTERGLQGGAGVVSRGGPGGHGSITWRLRGVACRVNSCCQHEYHSKTPHPLCHCPPTPGTDCVCARVPEGGGHRAQAGAVPGGGGAARRRAGEAAPVEWLLIFIIVLIYITVLWVRLVRALVGCSSWWRRRGAAACG